MCAVMCLEKAKRLVVRKARTVIINAFFWETLIRIRNEKMVIARTAAKNMFVKLVVNRIIQSDSRGKWILGVKL